MREPYFLESDVLLPEFELLELIQQDPENPIQIDLSRDEKNSSICVLLRICPGHSIKPEKIFEAWITSRQDERPIESLFDKRRHETIEDVISLVDVRDKSRNLELEVVSVKIVFAP